MAVFMNSFLLRRLYRVAACRSPGGAMQLNTGKINTP